MIFDFLSVFTFINILLLIISLFQQVQIRYTLKNGMKCLKILSKSHKVTKDREKSEQVCDQIEEQAPFLLRIF